MNSSNIQHEISHKETLRACSGNGNFPFSTVAALHQGALGQMTWLEDPPPWLKPWLRRAFFKAYCFASVIV